MTETKFKRIRHATVDPSLKEILILKNIKSMIVACTLISWLVNQTREQSSVVCQKFWTNTAASFVETFLEHSSLENFISTRVILFFLGILSLGFSSLLTQSPSQSYFTLVSRSVHVHTFTIDAKGRTELCPRPLISPVAPLFSPISHKLFSSSMLKCYAHLRERRCAMMVMDGSLRYIISWHCDVRNAFLVNVKSRFLEFQFNDTRVCACEIAAIPEKIWFDIVYRAVHLCTLPLVTLFDRVY